MPRYLRIYLAACVALAFGYLVVHLGEPLRLNVGDTWTDAVLVTSSELLPSTHASPLRAIVGRLFEAHQLEVFRGLALAFSGLAAWLLFQYARRIWNDTIAIIATALTTTSFLWMMFADGLHGPPIRQAACFLALWGVARALETAWWRHYFAALVGTFVCLAVGSNDWQFLSLGVLFTICVKRGNPFAWRVVAACAIGGLLAVLVRSPVAADPSSWQSALDQHSAATFATLTRRYTTLLTPMLWITLGWVVWRALRAPTLKAAIEDGTSWLLVAAVAFAYLPPARPESATLHTQLLLPLYAIGSAILIARLFDRGRWRRTLAVAWCVVAPLWGFGLMFSHPREVLDSDDVARANEYLAHNDRNSFVISNLLANGPILAAFGRHAWTAPHDPDPSSAQLRMLELFEATGSDYVHAVIFTTPGSRFVDRSIAQLSRGMASVTGWPYLVRAKVNALVDAYDDGVMRRLKAVGAVRVLHLSNFDIYRIDRTTTLETAARSLPVVQRIDLDSLKALPHQLLGWGDPVKPTEPRLMPSSIAGYRRCRSPLAANTSPAPNKCTVVETADGLDVLDVGELDRAELLVRVERACDQQLTITLAVPARVDVRFNGAVVLSCGDPQWGTTSASVRVRQHDVHPGLNIISLDDRQEKPQKLRPEVQSVVIEPLCDR